ncbi:hypothetical protein DA090_13450 [Photobacterium damselae]|nr:hypothetical protein DA090_13450 [Photobacterium damselae]
MTSCFELSDARLMYENDVISEVEIITSEDGRYTICFTSKSGQQFFLKTQRGSIRYFKTLDSAFATIESLGYAVSKLIVVKKGE